MNISNKVYIQKCNHLLIRRESRLKEFSEEFDEGLPTMSIIDKIGYLLNKDIKQHIEKTEENKGRIQANRLLRRHVSKNFELYDKLVDAITEEGLEFAEELSKDDQGSLLSKDYEFNEEEMVNIHIQRGSTPVAHKDDDASDVTPQAASECSYGIQGEHQVAAERCGCLLDVENMGVMKYILFSEYLTKRKIIIIIMNNPKVLKHNRNVLNYLSKNNNRLNTLQYEDIQSRHSDSNKKTNILLLLILVTILIFTYLLILTVTIFFIQILIQILETFVKNGTIFFILNNILETFGNTVTIFFIHMLSKILETFVNPKADMFGCDNILNTCLCHKVGYNQGLEEQRANISIKQKNNFHDKVLINKKVKENKNNESNKKAILISSSKNHSQITNRNDEFNSSKPSAKDLRKHKLKDQCHKKSKAQDTNFRGTGNALKDKIDDKSKNSDNCKQPTKDSQKPEVKVQYHKSSKQHKFKVNDKELKYEVKEESKISESNIKTKSISSRSNLFQNTIVKHCDSPDVFDDKKHYAEDSQKHEVKDQCYKSFKQHKFNVNDKVVKYQVDVESKISESSNKTNLISPRGCVSHTTNFTRCDSPAVCDGSKYHLKVLLEFEENDQCPKCFRQHGSNVSDKALQCISNKDSENSDPNIKTTLASPKSVKGGINYNQNEIEHANGDETENHKATVTAIRKNNMRSTAFAHVGSMFSVTGAILSQYFGY